MKSHQYGGKVKLAGVLALKNPTRGLDRVKQPSVAWRERLENELRKAAFSSVQPRCAQVQESSKEACATVASVWHTDTDRIH